MLHLEKTLWNNNDFDQMGWHDNRIWFSVADELQYEFILDIDYIFQWVEPAEGEHSFRFFVAQATMVFANPKDIRVNLHSAVALSKLIPCIKHIADLTQWFVYHQSLSV